MIVPGCHQLFSLTYFLNFSRKFTLVDKKILNTYLPQRIQVLLQCFDHITPKSLSKEEGLATLNLKDVAEDPFQS